MRNRRLPALDGLRGVAVLAVMAYHGGVWWASGGFLGVDVFFVLSGFLITSLLVAEREREGSISLRSFWSRRAKRLLPALLALLVAVAVYAKVSMPADAAAGLRHDALAVLAYVANWHFVLGGRSYFGRAAAPSLLQHTWSLAIEEQFYLVWPLLVVAVLGRRGGTRRRLKLLLAIAAGGAVASALEMALLFHPGSDSSRVYFGTDTHAQSVLVGAALAVAVALWRPRLERAGRRALSIVAFSGLLLTVLALGTVTSGSSRLYRGGFLAVDAAVVLLVLGLGLGQDSGPSRLLAAPPLRQIGAVSYGLYLWHWPVFGVLDASRTGLHGWVLLLVRTAVSAAIATISYHALEMPIRQGRVPRPVLRGLAPAGVAATAVAVLVFTATPPVPPPVSLAAWAGAGIPPPATTAATAETAAVTQVSHRPAVRVLLEGDSVALMLGLGLSAAEDPYGVKVDDRGMLGCGLADGFWVRDKGHVAGVPAFCANWPARWAADVAASRPDVAAVLVGRWDVMDRLIGGRWVHIGQPEFDAALRDRLTTAVRVLSSGGARVALLTMPCEDEGEQPDGSAWPQDDPGRIGLFNSMLRQVAAESSGRAVVVDLAALACPHGSYASTLHGVQVRNSDGVHFTIAGGAWLAGALLPEFVDLARP